MMISEIFYQRKLYNYLSKKLYLNAIAKTTQVNKFFTKQFHQYNLQWLKLILDHLRFQNTFWGKKKKIVINVERLTSYSFLHFLYRFQDLLHIKEKIFEKKINICPKNIQNY